MHRSRSNRMKIIHNTPEHSEQFGKLCPVNFFEITLLPEWETSSQRNHSHPVGSTRISDLLENSFIMAVYENIFKNSVRIVCLKYE